MGERGGKEGRERGSLLLWFRCQKDFDERTHISSSFPWLAPLIRAFRPPLHLPVCLINTRAGEFSF